MTEVVKFSSVCGQNISLSNASSTATWSWKNSGGHIFSKNPLTPGQRVKILFEGSGHCSVGYVTEDPNTCLSRIESVDLKTSKFHKQNTDIQISISENGREVILSWLGDKGAVVAERFKLQQKKQIWIALNIRFGLATVTFRLLDPLKRLVEFSRNHGANVNLEDNNTRAKSLIWSPASTCFLKNETSVGEELLLNCSPLLENGRTPSKYYLKLHVFDRDPTCLKSNFKFLFDASEVPVDKMPVSTLDTLSKEECNGTVSIFMISPSIIGYRTATSKYNQKPVQRSASNGVWIILELFRVSVNARRKPLPEKANADVVDGVIAEPFNANAENTLPQIFEIDENTDLKRVVSPVECSSVDETKCKVINDTSTKTVEGRIEALERGVHFIKNVLQSGQQSNMNVASTSVERKTNTRPKMNIASTSAERTINTRPNFASLVRDIDCMPLLDKLFERQVITQVDYDGIQQLGSRTDRNRNLLRLLSQKNVYKTTMDEILDSVEQGHLKNWF